MDNSEEEGSSSTLAPPTNSESPNATAFEKWRKKVWRAAGFGLSDDERLESMTRNCEKQKDYLMNYSAHGDLNVIRDNDFDILIRSNRGIYAQTFEIVRM